MPTQTPVALTPPELALLDEVFMHGPSVLKDAGWSSEQVSAFLSRPEIRLYFTDLLSDYNAQEIHALRTKFVTRRRLSRLSGASVATLRDALRGRLYKRNTDGSIAVDPETHKPIIMEYEPDPLQVAVARDVLDRVGVHDKQTLEKGPDVSLSIILGADERSAVKLEYAPGLETEQERALSRERVRTAIEKLMPQVEGARQKAIDVQFGKAKKKKPKRKKPKKS
jgi:hypothetical protein